MKKCLTVKEVCDILKDLPQDYKVRNVSNGLDFTNVKELSDTLSLLGDDFETTILKDSIKTIHVYPSDIEYVAIRTIREGK